MSNMAEQWLRSEVRSLRSRTARRGGQASFSPYVVVDTEALVAHLEPLKQMVKARHFVTVVPGAGERALWRGAGTVVAGISVGGLSSDGCC